ncbi:predicted protein [Nematostella vectensis]|uniref:Farnesyl pyrophosphate synthase n=1 Tax=Nematostella vectensis TaxID=45351 RepID=A7S5I7_NEMVE|nr:predicted protein [Nematostella vectensis]|eukprot:XP_001633044.1 predicted protein [Nematostella vectensis]
MSDSAKPKKSRKLTSDDWKLFDDAFPGFVNDLVQEEENDLAIGDSIKWLREVLEYNVPGGKRNRGLSVIGSLRHLIREEHFTDEHLRVALLLGWCVEWFQAFFLVADDIMDQSMTRRGQPCWYRQPEVGNIAINDGIMIEQTVFRLLKKHIKHQSYYVDVVELFHEVAYLTSLGQSLDLRTKPGENFEGFTLDRYRTIVKHKTAFYSFYLPVALAMFVAGIKDEASHANAKIILLEMGEFFQIQDDYIDVFGDASVTGKVGTDIEEGKCTWLVVQALKRANAQQLTIIKENLGINDIEASAKVKRVYRELNLEQVFHEYEEASYQRIIDLISKHSGDLPDEVFLDFVRKIYKRKK